MRSRGLRYWLPTYVVGSPYRQRLRAIRKSQLTHLLFLVCDHYEPRHGTTDPEQPAARVRAWHAGYKQMQDECFDRYGLRPLHSWFYPPHHGYEHLPALARMAFDGLGEIELHYHHHGDTQETLRAALQEVLARYRRAGLLLQCGSPPGRQFGFIHGDWALDNSGHGRHCGVNGELSLLQQLGCWGDLTMPSTNECQTRKINSIYYAVDSPERSKSHDRGRDAAAGQPGRDGFLLMQGPLGINWRGQRYPRVENASLTAPNWGSPARIQSWIDCHVHVRGRPQWLFIKLHTHGAIESDTDALFGKKARLMHSTLAERFNDGKRYKLHYVTAREAFNVVRAAEHGLGGDPSQYFDYELPRQATSLYCASVAHDLLACTPERLMLDAFEPGAGATIHLRYSGLERVGGPIRTLSIDTVQSVLELTPAVASSVITMQLAPGASVGQLSGASLVGQRDGTLELACTGPVRLEYIQPKTRVAAVGS